MKPTSLQRHHDGYHSQTNIKNEVLNRDHIDSRLPTIITQDTDRNASTTMKQSTMIFGIMSYITRAFFS
jgi:hypothetical protein